MSAISKLSKERGIVLTSYEKRSLLRFLALYLGSVFVLLAIIGYLFFENNKRTLIEALKFEMMYQAKGLASDIAMQAMSDEEMSEKERLAYLRSLKHCRFGVGYFDEKRKPIYSELERVPEDFGKHFSINAQHCYTVTRDPDKHLGIAYIVLEEDELAQALHDLRARIIGYLIAFFFVMGIVGYLLGRLFLKPVREQIESLDRFISDTTHELNTPISAILMTISSLKGVEEKKMRRLEASAKRLATTYASLTHRLEGDEQKPERLDMAELIRNRLHYMAVLFEAKGLHVSSDLHPFETMMTRNDAERLVGNLLSNAIKYSNRGGRVYVRLFADGRFEVEDEGVGIDKEAQKNIFKRYYRADTDRGGFGVGLSIVAEICKRYDCRLEVQSEKGKGSLFIIRFVNRNPR